MSTKYLMQARSDSSGAIVCWLSSTPNSASYPGPGSPLDLAILLRPAASGGGGGSLNAPASPGDNGKIAQASGGNLVYLAGTTQDDVLGWDATLGWISTPRAGLTINSFGANTPIVEVGQSVAAPGFTASYSSTPTTDTLTDNVPNASKNIISTPTAFTRNFTFVKNTFAAAFTFTITAVKGSSTASRNASITWGQRTYYGVGAAGLTTAGFIALAPASQVLVSRAISFTLSPSAQKIYLLIRTGYGTPTIKDNGTGFALAITKTHSADSVTNGFAFSEAYDLYETDFVLTGAITVGVT